MIQSLKIIFQIFPEASARSWIGSIAEKTLTDISTCDTSALCGGLTHTTTLTPYDLIQSLYTLHCLRIYDTMSLWNILKSGNEVYPIKPWLTLTAFHTQVLTGVEVAATQLFINSWESSRGQSKHRALVIHVGNQDEPPGSCLDLGQTWLMLHSGQQTSKLKVFLCLSLFITLSLQ